MTSREKNIIILILALIVLAGVAVFSYSRYPIWNPAIEVHDTIIKIDTVHHTIISEYPYYISKTDTVIIRDTLPAIIDTAAILQLYYAFHVYERSWNDSSLSVTVRDVVSENKYFDSDFSYQILRPQEIINTTNVSYSYSKYLYAGINLTLPNAEWSSLAVFFASKRALYGIGYIPYQKGLNVTGAITIGKYH